MAPPARPTGSFQRRVEVQQLAAVLLMAALIMPNPAAQTGPAASPQEAALPPLAVSRMAADGAQAVPAAPVQQPPPPALEPLPVVRMDERQLPPELESKRVTLTFAQPVAIPDLLKLLARDTNLSVIIEPGIDATFAGELVDVTLREALDLILRGQGLDYSVQGRVIRVFRRRMETRIFTIDYVATQRTGTRSISASTGAAGGAGGGVGGGPGGAGAPAATAGVGAGGAATAGSGGSSASVSGNESGDIFEELSAGISNVKSDDGRFNIDRKSGLLQVVDFPENIRQIEFYLETVMRRMQRQVLIEAQIVEVELRDQNAFGINWRAVLGSATGNNATVTQALAPSTSGIFTLGLTFKDLSALISAFETQGKVNVLSRPRVTAMNNEPALMRVGTQDVFFVTTTLVDPDTGGLLQSAVVPQTITEGVVLSVTPQISADGIIHMSISPTITERTGQATSRLGDTVPIVSVRETDTLVRVHQGETVVIAGLMQDRFNVDVAKVPLLGDLPGIGTLFRRTDRSKRKTDLVILLTPTILSPGQRATTAAEDVERIRQLQQAPLPRRTIKLKQ